jgi:hypothetical protein
VEAARVLLTRGAGQTAQNLVVRLIGGLISRRAFINPRAKPSEHRGFGHSLKRRACQFFTARETDILVSRGPNCIFNEGAKLIKLVLLQIMGNDSISAAIDRADQLADGLVRQIRKSSVQQNIRCTPCNGHGRTLGIRPRAPREAISAAAGLGRLARLAASSAGNLAALPRSQEIHRLNCGDIEAL